MKLLVTVIIALAFIVAASALTVGALQMLGLDSPGAIIEAMSGSRG